VEILIREYQKSDHPGNFDALIVRFEPTETFCGDCPEPSGDEISLFFRSVNVNELESSHEERF